MSRWEDEMTRSFLREERRAMIGVLAPEPRSTGEWCRTCGTEIMEGQFCRNIDGRCRP